MNIYLIECGKTAIGEKYEEKDYFSFDNYNDSNYRVFGIVYISVVYKRKSCNNF